MTEVDIGEFVGTFAAMLGLVGVWLLIAYCVAPLRRNPGVSYGIAMVLSGLSALVPLGGPTTGSVAAAAILVAVLWWQMRRARRLLAEKRKPV